MQVRFAGEHTWSHAPAHRSKGQERRRTSQPCGALGAHSRSRPRSGVWRFRTRLPHIADLSFRPPLSLLPSPARGGMFIAHAVLTLFLGSSVGMVWIRAGVKPGRFHVGSYGA